MRLEFYFHKVDEIISSVGCCITLWNKTEYPLYLSLDAHLYHAANEVPIHVHILDKKKSGPDSFVVKAFNLILESNALIMVPHQFCGLM